MNLPPDYSWSFGKHIQRKDEKIQQMLVNDLLALLLVYIVMASQFESLAHPFAILVSIPFALWEPPGFFGPPTVPSNSWGRLAFSS
jgi:HAE1 family hydrophobic/amphiphilic exporter-1